MRRLPPQSSLGLTQETRGKLVVFLEKVEQSEKWPQQACKTMFFLIPENVTSERPIALMPTLIRWWEAVWAPEVAKWQQKYRVDWDATRWPKWRSLADSLGNFDGNGVIQISSSGRRFGSGSLGSGPGEGLQARHPTCGLGLGDALQFPKEDLAGALWVFRAPEASAVRRMCGGAAPDQHGHLPRGKVELLVSTCCVAGRVKRGYKKLPSAGMEGLCG